MWDAQLAASPAAPQPRQDRGSGEDAQLLVAESDLVDRDDHGGGTQVHRVALSFPDFTNRVVGAHHCFLESGVYQVLFAGPMGNPLDLGRAEAAPGHALHRLEQAAVGALLEASLHSPEADMAEVLDPLEVRDRDAAGVDVGVGDDGHTAS